MVPTTHSDSSTPQPVVIPARVLMDLDRWAGSFLYALMAATAFALWRESFSSGAFVFFTLLPINIAVSA